MAETNVNIPPHNVLNVWNQIRTHSETDPVRKFSDPKHHNISVNSYFKPENDHLPTLL